MPQTSVEEKIRPASITYVAHAVPTLTKPIGTKPERKETERDMHDVRVVIVSPYENINRFIRREVERLLVGGKGDVVSRAERDTEPYVDVYERERHSKKPMFIIDFKSIVASVQTRVFERTKGWRSASIRKNVQNVVEFTGYEQWSIGKDIDYLSPTEDFSARLKAMHRYNREGNFDQTSIKTDDFDVILKDDLKTYVRRLTDKDNILELCLFDERK